MEAIYWTIAGLGLLLCFFIFLAYKLKKNRPNIKPELELFPVPEKKSKKEFRPLITAPIPERIVVNTKYRSNNWKVKNAEPMAYHAVDAEAELTQLMAEEIAAKKIREKTDSEWFRSQKAKALRQLRQFKFNKLEFIPEWTFEEDNQILKTQGYLLDASNTLNDVVNQLLINKQRVVFWLSPESDGIYHKRVISGGNKTEANVTIQIWSTPI